MSELVSGVAAYSMASLPGEEKGTEVNANQIVQEVKSLILVPDHISIIVDKNLPVTWGNKTKILQVFLNLINNSVKYIDQENGIIRIKGKLKGKRVTFCVEDNGPGISPKLRKQVFKIFNKGKSLRLDSQGIGLAIVQKVISELGGSIDIGESELGGAAFRFELPVMEELPDQSQPNDDTKCPLN